MSLVYTGTFVVNKFDPPTLFSENISHFVSWITSFRIWLKIFATFVMTSPIVDYINSNISRNPSSNKGRVENEGFWVFFKIIVKAQQTAKMPSGPFSYLVTG